MPPAGVAGGRQVEDRLSVLLDLREICWNLFLAAVPVPLGILLGRGVRAGRSPAVWLLLLPVAFAWLALLPNSAYLLTGARHFLKPLANSDLRLTGFGEEAAARDYLAASGLLALYWGAGLATLTLSVRPVSRALQERGVLVEVLAPPFFLAVACGVYLGFVIRLNSWDLLHNWRGVLRTAVSVLRGRETLPILLVLGGAFWAAHWIGDTFIEGLKARLERSRGPARPEARY